jgi:hypothetical protein
MPLSQFVMLSDFVAYISLIPNSLDGMHGRAKF